MNRNHPRHAILALAALLAAGLGAATVPGALAASPVELATTIIHSGGVDFQPNVEFRRATLTVSGDGRVSEWRFDAGDSLSIGLLDPQGQPLPDGVYNWRLQLYPGSATARELRIAASLNGGTAPGAWRALTGTFTVHTGQIADQGLGEQLPAAAEAGQGSGLTSTPAPSFAGASRGAAEDDDAAVGSRVGTEARLNAAAQQQSPAPAGGVLLQADRAAAEDGDATTAALGQTLEPAASSEDPLSAQSHQVPAPRPRSDGSNGRPRSDS